MTRFPLCSPVGRGDCASCGIYKPASSQMLPCGCWYCEAHKYLAMPHLETVFRKLYDENWSLKVDNEGLEARLVAWPDRVRDAEAKIKALETEIASERVGMLKLRKRFGAKDEERVEDWIDRLFYESLRYKNIARKQEDIIRKTNRDYSDVVEERDELADRAVSLREELDEIAKTCGRPGTCSTLSAVRVTLGKERQKSEELQRKLNDALDTIHEHANSMESGLPHCTKCGTLLACDGGSVKHAQLLRSLLEEVRPAIMWTHPRLYEEISEALGHRK